MLFLKNIRLTNEDKFDIVLTESSKFPASIARSSYSVNEQVAKRIANICFEYSFSKIKKGFLQL